MFQMALSSATLFFKGKLFAEPAKAFRQLALGVAATLALFLILGAIGAPAWLAAAVAGFAGGTLQPYLFKDLKYR